uniref:Immunoglobulin V-set domain-containing protein n=1 Tax=Oryzias latipes TaxID=8090 RepID=A0A3P9ME22_ORYLA
SSTLCQAPRGSGCRQQDGKLTAVKKEESTLEGTSVALSYEYSKTPTGSDEFYWYRQFPGKPPEFFFSHLGSKATLQSLDHRFSHEVKAAEKQIDLQISSAAVTDSAVASPLCASSGDTADCSSD